MVQKIKKKHNLLYKYDAADEKKGVEYWGGSTVKKKKKRGKEENK